VRGQAARAILSPHDPRVHPEPSSPLTVPSQQDRRRPVAVRVARALAQLVALGAAVWVLLQTARPTWGTLAATHVALRSGPLVGGSLVWLAAFAFLVELWARSLAWWGERLAPLRALRMFVLTNLARYIPGAVWQFAGLAALALDEGVSPLAASAAVLFQQLALLWTGVLLALAFAPALLTARAGSLPPWATAAVAMAGLVLSALFVPPALAHLHRRLQPLVPRGLPLPQPPRASFARYLGGSLLGWVGYGVAFWLFGRALLGAGAPGLLLAATAFVASYVAGIIAVFAPGGIVVREAALVAALGHHIGPDRAFVLAVAARLWLIGLEIIGAAAALAASSWNRASERERA
jgi:uncharacterized membrane protein YbhN (UPF0104 family)